MTNPQDDPTDELEEILNKLSSQQISFNARYWEPKDNRKAERLWKSYMDEATSEILEWRRVSLEKAIRELSNRTAIQAGEMLAALTKEEG